MSTETTDTNQEITPTGDFVFTVSKKVEKRLAEKSQKPFYIFKFEYMKGGQLSTHTEILMTWMAGPMIRALGGKEVKPNVFEWDREAVVGSKVKATIIHEPDFKDPAKMRAKMTNIQQDLPF